MSNSHDNVQFSRLISQYFSVDPSLVDGTNNFSFWFYRNYLYQLIYSRFEFENFPKTWDLDFFRDQLFQGGYMGITETEYGNVCLDCSYSGINPYRKPTHVVFANPVLGTFNRQIGVDVELVYFEYMNGFYQNIEQTVRRYATLLANIDASLNTNLMNTRVAYSFTSGSKNALESIKKQYDDVVAGNTAVFRIQDQDNTVETNMFMTNLKNNYIANDLLVTKQSLINEFLTIIGLRNANTQKRERLNSEEVHTNDEATKSLVEMWQDNINQCFDRAKALFPYLNVKCRIKKFDEDVTKIPTTEESENG